MEPSSSTTGAGFFQTPPHIPSQYDEDVALRRIIDLYLPAPTPAPIHTDLSRFSRLVLTPRVLAHIADAERHPPFLNPLTTFGAPNTESPLVTSEGWRTLQDLGIREGIVAIGYEDDGERWNRRVYQFVKYHLWSGSAAMVTCPSAMTDGAASLLGRHVKGEGEGKLFEVARRRLVSREIGEAWTSGQWMTERKGGSDVSGTETVARRVEYEAGLDRVGMPLGPWRIDGFKWFSSATDADMAVLLARTSKEGGLSAFYAPMRRRGEGGREGQTELNGVRIQRLKNKLGTKTVPTAELELKGMRGYLVGKEGEGVKEISTVLNITRVHNAVTAMGLWGRGLAVSRAFATVRKVAGGRLLMDVPAHVRGLAQEHVRYRAEMHLTFFVVALLGISEHCGGENLTAGAPLFPEDHRHVEILLRVLTPLMKAQTALASIDGLRACMESLGGVGYLENEDPECNIARLYRDANVLSIWEGTTDIMADDIVRVVKGRSGPIAINVMKQWVMSVTEPRKKETMKFEKEWLRVMWDAWQKEVESKGGEELKWKGKDILKGLEAVVCGCLLLLDVARDGDEITMRIARRWLTYGEKGEGRRAKWTDEVAWDRQIVFGDEDREKAKL